MLIVTHGKSLQHEGAGSQIPCSGVGEILNDQMNGGVCTTPICEDEIQDPSVHPWGGLTTTGDEELTLLNCYLYSKSLEGLQNVHPHFYLSCKAQSRLILFHF